LHFSFFLKFVNKVAGLRKHQQMKRVFFLIATVAQLGADAQTENSARKRFIDKVEFVIGPTLQFPDDNGFSERLKQSSLGNIFDSYNSKFGYSLGFGFSHSISDKVGINCKLLWEQKGFIEETKSISPNSLDFITYKGNLESKYITLAVAPVFYFSKKRKIQLYPGIYYSWLQGSFRKEELYRNNLLTQTGSITNDPNLKDDYGVLIGAGYPISLSSKINLTFHLQLNYGLAKIMDINFLRISNNSICLFTAFSFRRLKIKNPHI
jgi:hypothetical protein